MFKYITLKYLKKLKDYYTHQLLSIEVEISYGDMDNIDLIEVYKGYLNDIDKIDGVINIIKKEKGI